jgi:abequosyltransferase
MCLLSLAIPTYNRAALLSQALSAIVAQLDDATIPQIEIIIADNASPDDTEAFMCDFIADHPGLPIIYHRQPQNLGGDANVNTLLGLAHGTFFYILSDDDILLPGALAWLLNAIHLYPALDAVCLNMRSFLESPDEAGAPMFALEQDLLMHGRDAALGFLSTWLTFLSGIAFRRAALHGRSYEDKIGKLFLHSYVFIDALSVQGDMLVSSQAWLAIRSGNTGAYNFYETFLTRFAGVLQYAESVGYTRRAVRTALTRHQPFITGFTLTFKLRGAYSQLKPDYGNGIRGLLDVYRYDPIFVLQTILLMLLPQSLAPLARRVRRSVRRRRLP